MITEGKLSLHGVVIQSQQSGFTGYFTEFPEAIAEGETEEEVKKNLFEALMEVLSYKREQSGVQSKEGSSSFEVNLELA